MSPDAGPRTPRHRAGDHATESLNLGDLTALAEAIAVMDRLRSPGGCPWDAEQTHASLAPYAIEEAHELAEAAESGDLDHLREELGDLLLQVLFHARIAQESDPGFTLGDVARGFTAKMTRRHPHVFGDGPDATGTDAAGTDATGTDATGTDATGTAASAQDVLSAQDVASRWEVLKAAEQRRPSVLDGIPASLPSLARAQKVLSRLQRADLTPTLPSPHTAEGAFGARLLDLVHQAHEQGIDAEAALRAQVRELVSAARQAEGGGNGEPQAGSGA